MQIRNAEPDDYPEIIAVVDEWWGGRKMTAKLPKLFFDHFGNSSFVATDGESIHGFVIGFQSQTDPQVAYIHFVGLDPQVRGSGLGRTLYECFFDLAIALGCSEVQCVTSPINERSIAFHQAMGFEVLPGEAVSNGVEFTPNHDGPDGDCVRFRRRLLMNPDDQGQ